jgi:hypothetical protein
VARELISVEELPWELGRERLQPENTALQGTIARGGQILLLALDAREERGAR